MYLKESQIQPSIVYNTYGNQMKLILICYICLCVCMNQCENIDNFILGLTIIIYPCKSDFFFNKKQSLVISRDKMGTKAVCTSSHYY